MHELLAHPAKVVILIGLLTGLVMLVGSLFGKWGRTAPAWARKSLWLSWVAMTVFLVLTFYVVVRRPVLSQQAYDAIVLVKDAVGAFGAGILVTLLISGELKRWLTHGH
jgi:hypothetical protein